MNAAQTQQSKIQNLKSKIFDFGRLVRFSHTVFALPFALASVALAWPQHPVTPRALLWILVAMVAARTAAMGFNRLEAIALTTPSATIFVITAYQLNWICFVLSPVALLIVFFYSLTKRFTWASHLFLGLALSIAPIGAWLAVASPPFDLYDLAIPIFLGLAVIFWLAGFDIIYSLQDRQFDRAHGLYSIPVRFGVAGALQFSSFFHLLTVVCLAVVGLTAELGLIYWLGFSAIAVVLFWEHRIVTPNDLSRINRAFFDFNAYVSIGYFLATLVDIWLASRTGLGS